MAAEPLPFRDSIFKALNHAEDLRALLLQLATEHDSVGSAFKPPEGNSSSVVEFGSPVSEQFTTTRPSEGMIALTSDEAFAALAP
eukprot:5820596-Amphidinium_carterae.1